VARCANAQGFSLHAAVRWGADQRQELDRLCCHIARPAIANERLKHNGAGQVVLQLKSAFKDGNSHIVMAPLEFIQRLAAPVPRPCLHLIRCHGVLAPNAKLRAEIIPRGRNYGQLFTFDLIYNPTRFWRITFHDPPLQILIPGGFYHVTCRAMTGRMTAK
jgi:hypothetical protein